MLGLRHVGGVGLNELDNQIMLRETTMRLTTHTQPKP